MPRSVVLVLQVNRFGVRPYSGEMEVITDLSFSDGASVNDGIDPGLCLFTYTSVDRVA